MHHLRIPSYSNALAATLAGALLGCDPGVDSVHPRSGELCPDDKATICHVPPGHGTPTTICVDEAAADALFDHGDLPGPCEGDEVPPDECPPVIECGAGTVLDGSVCVEQAGACPTCGPGTAEQDGVCTLICVDADADGLCDDGQDPFPPDAYEPNESQAAASNLEATLTDAGSASIAIDATWSTDSDQDWYRVAPPADLGTVSSVTAALCSTGLASPDLYDDAGQALGLEAPTTGCKSVSYGGYDGPILVHASSSSGQGDYSLMVTFSS